LEHFLFQVAQKLLCAHFQLHCPLDTLQEIALLMVVQLLQVAHHNATPDRHMLVQLWQLAALVAISL
jgi:hypothetical protein